MGHQEAGRYVRSCVFRLLQSSSSFAKVVPRADRSQPRSSDADSDVLADYVLALIRADTPEPELRANAIENLEDFLKGRGSSYSSRHCAWIAMTDSGA